MPKETLSEARMIRASTEQVNRWKESAEVAGYWSVSEWIRDTLDAAAGGRALGEVVSDDKAVCVYLPNKDTDRRPYVVELAAVNSGSLLLDRLTDVSQRAWCTPELLYKIVLELAKAWKRVNEPAAAPAKERKRKEA